jgi:nucleoside-diphosphate-sugar epimerase
VNVEMTQKFWTEKRVLVTGGAGFIGSHLVKALVKKGASVKAADNLSRGTLNNLSGLLDKVEFSKVDLTKETDCLETSKEIDVIFHLAASVGGIEFIKKENVVGLTPSILMNTHMLEAARRNDVQDFLFASSACVYHEENQRNPLFLKEEDAYPAEPHTTYGWAKLLGEIQCEAYAKDYGMKTSAIRLFSIYGENENLSPKWSHVIPALIRKAILYPKEPFAVFGNGEQTRAFLYVKDAVEALLLSIEKYTKSDPINIGSDQPIKICDLAKKIINISRKNIKIVYDTSKPTGIHGYYANYQKARSLLGWRPEVSLDEGLKKTYEWANNQLS